MPLPRALAAAIERELQGLPSSALKAAAARLSRAYQAQEAALALHSHAERLAYCAARMPATFAALEAALAAAGDALSSARSMLDVGSGPGTAAWALANHLPALSSITCLEAQAPWAELAGRLAAQSEAPALRNAHWLTGNAATRALPAADITSAAYVLNELAAADAQDLVRRLWDAAAKAVLLLEPGSKGGYARIAAAREILMAGGATLIAPCTHHAPCPMRDGDWCHFSVRLERTRFQRTAKDAELSYEDEKFSYLIAVKSPPHPPAGRARIVRRPMRGSGHVTLDLCSEKGLLRATIPRSAGAPYRDAKKAQWGDAWPPGAEAALSRWQEGPER